MDIRALSEKEIARIDLHGFTVWEAEEELIVFLDEVAKPVRAVEVTHGYSHGTALKRMVRQDFYHWRVRDKQVGLNPGCTWLILK
jgi:DNA-nicking Smr family endonuclease